MIALLDKADLVASSAGAVSTHFKNDYVKQAFIFLLTIFVLTSCNEGRKIDENKTINTFVGTSNDTLQTNHLTKNVRIDSSLFKFKNAKEQADTLSKYFDKKQLATDEKFFSAFPNSFKEMQEVFGFDDSKGSAPLYDYPNGENMIKYFAKLNSIPKDIYYDKYINICLDGIWEADNIREAFGFADRLTNDTEAACLSLAKRTDKEIKSVFHFIFDGPHPKNEYNEKIYTELLPILTKQDERLGKLLKETYNKVITEDDGHGH